MGGVGAAVSWPHCLRKWAAQQIGQRATASRDQRQVCSLSGTCSTASVQVGDWCGKSGLVSVRSHKYSEKWTTCESSAIAEEREREPIICGLKK